MKNRLRLMAAQCTAIVLSLIMAFTIFPMAVSAETGDGDDTVLQRVPKQFRTLCRDSLSLSPNTAQAQNR